MNAIRKNLLLAAALAAALPALQGCFPLVATGAAISAVSAVDRRTTGAQVDDQAIELRASTAIKDRVPPIKAHASVTSFNRRVLLTGQVSGDEVRQEVGRIAAGVSNVREVVNELEVAGGAGFGTSANDAFITSKIRATLLDAKDVPDGSIKIVTERGVVYLMGLVTQTEGDRAAQLTSGVSGVIKVVKVFEIIGDDEAARLRTRAPSNESAPAPAK